MSPRRHLLPLLSALALLLTPFALAPRSSEAQGNAYLVDTASDVDNATCATRTLADGDCTLRQALTLANADGGASTITFFAGIYGQTITLADPNQPLPALSANGTSINAFAGLPRIAINGNGSSFNGLTVTGSNNSVTGLSLYGFICSANGAGGVVVEGAAANGNVIEGNYIGVDLSGTAPASNQRNCNGVVVRGGAASNIIRNNVISANAGDGVLIRNASDNIVTGNRIGLAPIPNDTLVGNGQNGVNLFSFPGENTLRNRIGGTAFNEQNVIGGSASTNTSFAGVRVQGSGTLTSTISSNYIGTDSIGSIDRGNLGDGILVIAGARGTTIQGTGAAPLVVSGNDGYGIRITGNTTSGTTISGAYVGINGAGGTTSAIYPTATIPNSLDGIRIDAGATNTSVTGTAVNRTVVAGNAGRGIVVDGASTATTRVENSLIGVVVASTTSAPQPNTLGGVLVNGARGTTLAGNTISGNSAYGVRLSGTQAVTVTGNFVGLSLNRKAVQGNGGPGIQLWNAPNTLIGGGSSTTNYIAGNTGPGVVISGTNSLSVAVRTNLIGLVQEAATTNYLGRGANAGEGVLVTGGARNVSISGNTIAASADTTATDFAGVSVLGDGSAGLSATNVATVTVSSNRIGWLPQSQGSSVQVPFPNGDGVVVAGGVQGVAILTNTIRLNVGAAIRLTDALTPTVRGNQIQRNAAAGVVAGGDTPGLRIERNAILESGRNSLGAVVNPAADGILLSGDEGIAGTQILSNTVRANTGRAIALEGDVNRATMRFNLLALNGDAIRLVGSTIFDGTLPDPDTQATPNRGIDPPIVDLSFTNPLGIRVNQAGFVDGYVYTNTSSVQPITEASLAPISACVTCTIQIFRPDRAAPADAQGGELIFTIPESGGTTPRDTIPVAANGRFSARIQDTLPERLLFIATDGFGNSSEYAVFPLTAGVVLEPVSPLAVNAAPGDTVTYTLRLRNTGTLAYTNLNLATSGTLAGWDLVTEPFTNTAFSLAGGASRLITATLTLPTGSDPNVAAGTVDSTTLTITGGPPAVNASATLQTTVLPRPVIAIEPRSSLGSGRPTTPVPHAFAITNNGNVTVTLDLDYTTVDPALSPGVWATSINTTTLTLGPGADARVGLSVTVPQGALQNASATTYLTATVRPGTSPVFPGQTVPFSATTRAELNPNADLFPDVEARASAGGSVALTHNVVNRSNGTATFCLDYFSASQSTARFEPATSGFVIDARGCFTLYAAADVDPGQGRFNEAQLRAVVTVDDRLTTGDIETVTIFLRQGSPTGESISDATVEDKIIVIAGQKIPRLWMPLLRR